jgi:hypothetical protein
MTNRFLRAALWYAAAALLGSVPLIAETPVQQLPIGTLLPVILDSTLNSGKLKVGQKVSAKLKQDVALPDNGRVKAGSDIFGHVISVSPAAKSSGAGATLVLSFDSLRSDGRDYPLTTSLRAIASMQAVYQARLPINGAVPDNLSVWDWNTRQIGGDIVFGGQRKVESVIGTVGTMVEPGSVIGVTRANPDAGCMDNSNKTLQAFWVFSTDACGVYGWEDLKMVRANDDVAAGKIVLVSPKQIDIRSGAGLLLEVEKQAGGGPS